MKFSLLSWNIEKLAADAPRMKKIAAHIRAQDPDVFGLLEIMNADVRALMEQEFPGYDFALTDGPEVQEILVGWRRNKFDQAAFTQKRDFNVGNPKLRPGALLSLRHGTDWFNVLFLHTDSGNDAPAFGNRVEMFQKTWKLKTAIDKKLGGPDAGNLIVLGDLNTMGLMFPLPKKVNERVNAPTEIDALAAAADEAGMTLLPKDQPKTWKGGAGESNLDHVLASNAIKFRSFGAPENPAHVRVLGWNQLSGPARKTYLAEVSDHSSLYVEVD